MSAAARAVTLLTRVLSCDFRLAALYHVATDSPGALNQGEIGQQIGRLTLLEFSFYGRLGGSIS